MFHLQTTGVLTYIIEYFLSIYHWCTTDLILYFKNLPTLAFAGSAMTIIKKPLNEEDSVAIATPEPSIKIPVAVLAVIVIGAFTANWVLFTMYMDSKWTSIERNFTTIEQRIDAGLQNIQTHVNLRLDVLQNNYVGLEKRTDALNQTTKEIVKDIESKTNDRFRKKEFDEYMFSFKEVLSLRFSAIDTKINQINTHLTSGPHDNVEFRLQNLEKNQSVIQNIIEKIRDYHENNK